MSATDGKPSTRNPMEILYGPSTKLSAAEELLRQLPSGEITLHANEKTASQAKWDRYFHNLCLAVASHGSCLSRKIGVVITKNKRLLATGYNGPAEGIPHCGTPRALVDLNLQTRLRNFKVSENDLATKCPRRLLEIPSGDPRVCTAVHAEMNAIITAARMGVALEGATLWMNSVISCKNCFSSIINAGIIELVVEKMDFYDEETRFIAANSDIKVREFILS